MTENESTNATVIDARGLACPQPVVLTRKALDRADRVTVIVDNETAAQNVSRLAKSQGCQISVENREDGTYLHLSGRASQEENVPPVTGKKIAVFIGSSTLGQGDEGLGNILMRSFMHTLREMEEPPARIIFMNSGVEMVTEKSDVLDDLQALEEKGVEVLACGTCLGYYKLKDAVRAGRISNMYDITAALLEADRVISL